ncbi:glycylpeptide N-tetradecanoyltransferase [Babesia caballi]|uniref:glycylpeptide N-tetradecanoyltransferase n=1 Tax=Babesia caballi TaxID=5871 RepID=A0AAV4LWG6_BABCB|nr:glycylpeptide N-tetradecanoyltransferase [Babesia caballi]
MEQNDKQNDAPGDEKQNGDVLAKALAALQLTVRYSRRLGQCLQGEKGAKPDAASAKRIAALLGRALAQSDTVERDHTFWNTQPVCQVSEEVKSDVGLLALALHRPAAHRPRRQPKRRRKGPSTPLRPARRLRVGRHRRLRRGPEDPGAQPPPPSDSAQLYHLLNENYVEDSDSMFRFDYKAGFLRWAMTPPGYKKDWLIGVRVKASKRMVGFISGIPVKLSVCGTVMEVAEINFLCVHKQLRSKRLAPVLIREVTRRVNLCNIWQAVGPSSSMVQPPPGLHRRRFHHQAGRHVPLLAPAAKRSQTG